MVLQDGAERYPLLTRMFSRVDLSTSPPSVEIPFRYNASVDLLDQNLAAGRSAKAAYVDDHGTTTFAELAARASRFAHLLRARGVHPEQRIVLALHDSADFPALFLGAIRAGIVPVPVNTLLTPADWRFMVDDARAKLVVVSDPLAERMHEALAGLPDPPPILRASELDVLLAPLRSTFTPAPTTRDDVAFWLYSSGSTGAPKGAMHLHAHLVRTSALYARAILGLSERDVVFSAAKLFFAYGLGNALTFPLSVGATTILLSERPTPAAVMRVLHNHRPTVFCGVPTLFASILADPANGPAPGLRLCTSAGEALPKHVGETWRERFGADICDGIGSTEMLHIFLSNRPGDVRYGTTGKVVPGYELRLTDDEGNPTDGAEGLLWVRGETACAGYWNQREKSLATFHGPWTRTGDRYSRDADGYYTYAGRADDMLKVSGIWVSPFEVESALMKHPAVLEAAVVGAIDEAGLVKPKAFVVPKDASAATPALADELKVFVKSILAPYKYPRWIELVRELPKTATGKIQRFKLRAG
jgi:benzoate-CoA ligase family protein